VGRAGQRRRGDPGSEPRAQGPQRLQEAHGQGPRGAGDRDQGDAIAWGVGLASIEEIEELNILHAAGLAMCRAIEALSVKPAFALVDGNYAFKLPCPIKTVIKGDSLSCSIAAASILAKEARDRIMVEMDGVYPGYGFAGHKGYHAPIHVEGLRRLGPSPIHRMGWAPVKLAWPVNWAPTHRSTTNRKPRGFGRFESDWTHIPSFGRG
jgi:hypothetical protein